MASRFAATLSGVGLAVIHVERPAVALSALDAELAGGEAKQIGGQRRGGQRTSRVVRLPEVRASGFGTVGHARPTQAGISSVSVSAAFRSG